MRFSRAKPVGSFRVLQLGTRRVASHDETLSEARKSAAYWTSAVSSPMVIQERFPSGEWVTVETVNPKRPQSSATTSHARRALPDRYGVVETVDGEWMILIDGIQTGSKRDRSGAGSDTYPTYAAAHAAALKMARGHATKRQAGPAGKIQVGSYVELPPRSSYREPDPEVDFPGDTHGEVVKIKNDAAWVRMDSDRMDWFPIASLRLAAPRRSRATKRGAKIGGRSTKLAWKKEPGSHVQAPISHGGSTHHYVISHRPDLHTVSYRPPGQHHHVGSYKTEREAKAAAAAHAATGAAPPSTDRWSVAAWGPQGRPR